jgi:hypothetical protein
MTSPPEHHSAVLRAPRRLYGVLVGVSAVLTALAYGLGGLDMAKGALLGCAVVGLNLMGTVVFVRRVLRDRRYKALLAVSLLIKFVLTLIVLYIAIVRLDMSALGIVIGLSAMLLASLVYAAIRPGG